MKISHADFEQLAGFFQQRFPDAIRAYGKVFHGGYGSFPIFTEIKTGRTTNHVLYATINGATYPVEGKLEELLGVDPLTIDKKPVELLAMLTEMQSGSRTKYRIIMLDTGSAWYVDKEFISDLVPVDYH